MAASLALECAARNKLQPGLTTRTGSTKQNMFIIIPPPPPTQGTCFLGTWYPSANHDCGPGCCCCRPLDILRAATILVWGLVFWARRMRECDFVPPIACNLGGGTHHAHAAFGSGFTIFNDLARRATREFFLFPRHWSRLAARPPARPPAYPARARHGGSFARVRRGEMESAHARASVCD